MTSEGGPPEGFWQKALQGRGEVAAAGLGGGGAFFLDASTNMLNFVEPLTALGPGAVAGIGIFGFAKGVISGLRRRQRCSKRTMHRFGELLASEGAADLASEVERLHLLFKASALSAADYLDELDRIFEEFKGRPRGGLA